MFEESFDCRSIVSAGKTGLECFDIITNSDLNLKAAVILDVGTLLSE